MWPAIRLGSPHTLAPSHMLAAIISVLKCWRVVTGISVTYTCVWKPGPQSCLFIGYLTCPAPISEAGTYPLHSWPLWPMLISRCLGFSLSCHPRVEDIRYNQNELLRQGQTMSREGCVIRDEDLQGQGLSKWLTLTPRAEPWEIKGLCRQEHSSTGHSKCVDICKVAPE